MIIMIYESKLTDSQIIILIKKYQNSNYAELLKYANIEFPNYKWNYNKIYNSIKRLKNRLNIQFNDCREIIKENYILDRPKKIIRIRC